MDLSPFGITDVWYWANIQRAEREVRRLGGAGSACEAIRSTGPARPPKSIGNCAHDNQPLRVCRRVIDQECHSGLWRVTKARAVSCSEAGSDLLQGMAPSTRLVEA
jgi:hypothetical protein